MGCVKAFQASHYDGGGGQELFAAEANRFMPVGLGNAIKGAILHVPPVRRPFELQKKTLEPAYKDKIVTIYERYDETYQK